MIFKLKKIYIRNNNWMILGFSTWPNQDDQMNMTEIGEHDRKIDKDEH